MRLENCLELLYKLGCKLLLSKIIWTLYNDGYETIIWYLAINAFLLRLSAHLAKGLMTKETRWLFRDELFGPIHHIIMKLWVTTTDQAMS